MAAERRSFQQRSACSLCGRCRCAGACARAANERGKRSARRAVPARSGHRGSALRRMSHGSADAEVASPRHRAVCDSICRSRFCMQTVKMQQQLAARTMPVGNVTGLTEAERAELLAWIARGSPH